MDKTGEEASEEEALGTNVQENTPDFLMPMVAKGTCRPAHLFVLLRLLELLPSIKCVHIYLPGATYSFTLVSI